MEADNKHLILAYPKAEPQSLLFMKEAIHRGGWPLYFGYCHVVF